MNAGKQSRMTNTPTPEPPYVRIVGDFRRAETLSELKAYGEKHKEEVMLIGNKTDDFSQGLYHSIRNAYVYYLRPLQEGCRIRDKRE